MTEQFAQIGLSLIAPSLTNPRKTFNQVRLQELADSIKASGVHTPVLVRMLPGHRVGDTDRSVIYELVAGERRYRASEMAGVDTIPALIRPLTDAQVLEIQLIENLHRDDLTPLEEAEGYEALMEHTGMTAAQVGEKINKSRTYVYNQLKLLDLCSEARTSLRDGTVDASRALLVARIPDHKLQLKAMGDIVKGERNYSGGQNEPMSYRQAAAHLQSNYMLKLSDAKFKRDSIELVPAAGACKTCTKRTGHNPDLFSDVKSADVCIDPPCFHKKEEAHAAQLVAAAKDKGQTVIAGKEAQELRASNSYYDKFVGYRRLDSVEDSPTDQPLRKLIGTLMKAEGIKPVLIESSRKNGELVECLPNETVLKLLKTVERQAATKQAVTKDVQKMVDDKKAKAEAKAKDQFEREWRKVLVSDTHSAMRDDADIKGFNMDVHRYLAVRAARSLSTDNAAAICQLLDLGKVSPGSAVVDYAKETINPELLNLLIIMQEASGANEHSYGGRIPNEGLMLVAGNVFGEKLDAVIKEIKGEVKARIWPKVKPEKTPLPLASAAQPESAAGKPKQSPAAPLAKKAKLSAEDAKSGIAAAMQGMEQAQTAAPEGLQGDHAEAQALYEKALYLVTREQKANVRLLKSNLAIGTAKAMELMTALEKAGKVSPCVEGGSIRKVLVAA